MKLQLYISTKFLWIKLLVTTIEDNYTIYSKKSHNYYVLKDVK